MRAVLRLLKAFFAPTALMRWLGGLGLLIAVTGLLGSWLWVEPQMLAPSLRDPSWLAAILTGMPWIGTMLMIASGSMMPSVVERLALGRTNAVLPHGRIVLFCATVLAAAILALFIASAATIMFSVIIGLAAEPGISGAQWQLFRRALYLSFIDVALVYMAIWLVGKTHGIWRLAGIFWVVIAILLPLRLMEFNAGFSLIEVLGIAAWLLFAAACLGGDRIAQVVRGLRVSLASRFSPKARSIDYETGSETALMLGTASPWTVALGQLVPIGLMTWFIPADSRRYWLVFLIVFSAIAGAITSQAAARCRRLWLRRDWTRIEIFAQAERAYWRYNVCLLAVLLWVFAMLGLYEAMSAVEIAFGLGVLVLGCAVCTYLGFMITQGLGWFEAIVCILTMTALTLASIAVITLRLEAAAALGILTAVLTIAYRSLARTRWKELDWMRSGAAV